MLIYTGEVDVLIILRGQWMFLIQRRGQSSHTYIEGVNYVLIHRRSQSFHTYIEEVNVTGAYILHLLFKGNYFSNKAIGVPQERTHKSA